jgi:hypothetical protein
MANDDYYSQIAQYREQRHQREQAQEAEQLQRDYADNVRQRDEAAARGDVESFEFYDRLAEADEQQWQEKYAPQQETISEAKAQWTQRHKSFIDRYGQKGIEALGLAHRYATTPRDPTTTDNRQSGMGLVEDSDEYFSAMENLLQMYGQSVGVNFDPSETLTADEVVKASGITPREYNKAAKKMRDTGHDSISLYGKMYGRRTG